MNKSYVIWDNEQHGWFQAQFVDWDAHMCKGVWVIDLTKATRFVFREVAHFNLHLKDTHTVFEA